MEYKDGRELWLDESMSHALTFLAKLIDSEEKRPLTETEENLKQLAETYCYLHNKAQEKGMLDSEGEEFLFKKEIIH